MPANPIRSMRVPGELPPRHVPQLPTVVFGSYKGGVWKTCLSVAVAERLANFERYFESIARPFEWKFTRADLNDLMARMRNRWAQSQHLKLAA